LDLFVSEGSHGADASEGFLGVAEPEGGDGEAIVGGGVRLEDEGGPQQAFGLPGAGA